MKNLIQNTLNKIKKEHIAPEPRWKFLARKILIWLLVGFIVALGAVAISVVHYLLSQLEWDLYIPMHQNFFVFTLSIMPYSWLVLLIIFGIAAFFGVRKTENGYRFGGLKIIFSIVIGVIVIGFFMSSFGFNRRFNGMMMHGVPYYAQNVATKEKQWMQPEKGLLAGTITAIQGSTIKLTDLNNVYWEVQRNEKTLVRPMADVSVGQMIKLIGTKQAEKNFIVTEIRPWAGCGMMDAGTLNNSTGTCGKHNSMMSQ